MAGNGSTAKPRKGRKKNKTKKTANTPQQVARETTVKRKRSKKSKIAWQGSDGTISSEKDYIKMALDPCHGPITHSPFGTSENSYIWRLNYRSVQTSNSSGHMAVALFSNGVYNGFGSAAASLPQLIQVWNDAGFNDTGLNRGSTVVGTVPGLTSLLGIAEQVRITAGCVKLNYIGPATVAQGELYAWEGQGDGAVAHVPATQTMLMVRDPQELCLNGMTAPITAGVESRLNYAKVASETQRAWGDMEVGRADVFCPVAIAGISGGPPSTNYVVEATIIVEWTPALKAGVPAPPAPMRNPGAAERVANALKQVAPLLVSVAGVPLGGYAGAFGKAVKFGAAVYSAM